MPVGRDEGSAEASFYKIESHNEVDSSVEASFSESEIDDEHVKNDVEVDMKDYYQNTDKDAEWVGSQFGNAEVPANNHVEETFDLDDFESASDSEMDGKRKKTLRNLKRQKAKECKGIDKRKCPVFRYHDEDPNSSGLNAGPSLGRPHCDVLLNNMCEVFNRRLLDGRDVSIITFLEYVKDYLTKKIVNVKKVIAKSQGPLTPAATELFNAIKSEANSYTINYYTHALFKLVMWNGGTKYQASSPWDDIKAINGMRRGAAAKPRLNPYEPWRF
ncbi:zinc finger, SWIM-type [Artemisia annua]|uniref:Zinc finger, SWIM-type n=1 Tax=Artemisia annua TaxID=35608 RepID=A0A2U1MJL9_ARTAN|nr:zinc finger, SWIM-type [Artemisia annua]